MTTTTETPQILLPGQAAAPAGPCDMSGMYLMHHAFRRDLRDLAGTAEHTPLDDADTWSAVRERWQRFSHHLHEHHSVEDRVLWPLLLERARAAGDDAALAVLDDMEAEHALIDPLLERTGALVARMATAPDGPTRRDLVATLGRAATTLDDHLAHEERDAVPLVQRWIGAAEWERLERTEFRGRPSMKELRFQLPWMVEGVPAEVERTLVRAAGPVFGLILRLSRRGFAREQERTFRHLP